MTLKDNFLKEIKIGNQVDIVSGPIEITGLVIGVDLDTVKVRKDNGNEPTISLDYISYYEIVKDYPEEEMENSELIEALSKTNNNGIIETSTANNEEANYNDDNISFFIKKLNERGNSFFEKIEEPFYKEYNELSESIEDVDLKKEVEGIIGSLDYAFNKLHEKYPTDYKINENIGKIKKLSKIYPDSNIPNILLAALYNSCKCEKLAYFTYEKMNNNELAFILANKIKDEEQMNKYAVRHFIMDSVPNSFIYKFIIEKMINRNDYSLFYRIPLDLLNNKTLQSYHSALRLVLIANNVSYNVILDTEVSNNSIDSLMKIFKNKIIGNSISLLEYLPKDFQIINGNIDDIEHEDF